MEQSLHSLIPTASVIEFYQEVLHYHLCKAELLVTGEAPDRLTKHSTLDEVCLFAFVWCNRSLGPRVKQGGLAGMTGMLGRIDILCA